VNSDEDDILYRKRRRTRPLGASFTGFRGRVCLADCVSIPWVSRRIVLLVNHDSKRRVEVVIRLEYPTNPSSVAALLKHPRVAIRAAEPGGMPFHEKLFLAIASDSGCIGAHVGSANWTHGGLRRNREAGVWVSEQEVLRQMASHFTAQYQAAVEISDHMLAELRSDFLWHATQGRRPKKDRGTIISSWKDLRARRAYGQVWPIASQSPGHLVERVPRNRRTGRSFIPDKGSY
jgi:hypothetical protein